MSFCSRIVAIHERYESRSELPRVFGDGHLVEHNPLYAAIRNEVRNRGYRFDCDSAGAVKITAALPLLALPAVLEQRVIPYRDNVTGLRMLVRRYGLEGMTPAQLHKFMTGNVVLHESAHCVAAGVLGGGVEQPALERPWPRRNVTITLAAESFATTVELMAWLTSRTAIERFFLVSNSYVHSQPENVTAAAARMTSRKGCGYLVRVAFFGFLAANFLRDDDMDAALAAAMALTGDAVDPALEDDVRTIFLNSLTLDKRFRTETAEVYFSCLGGAEAHGASIDFDPFELLRGDAALFNGISTLLEFLQAHGAGVGALVAA